MRILRSVSDTGRMQKWWTSDAGVLRVKRDVEGVMKRKQWIQPFRNNGRAIEEQCKNMWREC